MPAPANLQMADKGEGSSLTLTGNLFTPFINATLYANGGVRSALAGEEKLQ